ncbi:hypothetical protein D3C77_807250 [compost metagenome]
MIKIPQRSGCCAEQLDDLFQMGNLLERFCLLGIEKNSYLLAICRIYALHPVKTKLPLDFVQ